MIKFFSSKPQKTGDRHPDFSYINGQTHYFDSACQTMRPQPVIDAELAYYHGFNACGHRVKYPWGEKVDSLVGQTRKDLVAFAGKRYQEYETCFTLNTTYGINLVLQQLPLSDFKRVVISDIEHNSVFLPSIEIAKRYGLEHVVLSRAEDGSLVYKEQDLANAVILLNTTSNIDGRTLANAAEVATAAHANGSLLLIDAAQSFGHTPAMLADVDFDAAFTSGHKMYGPSIGAIVIKRSLLARLSPAFVGGGMVTDVHEHEAVYITDERELFSRLEPGLQSWAGIIGLQAAAVWIKDFRHEGKTAEAYEHDLALHLRQGLESISGLRLASPAGSSTQSVYTDKLDAHQLALALGQQGMMARSGYFCCHYFLKQVKGLPPLLRISLGLHNTRHDIDTLIRSLQLVMTRF